jgi:hypothetical protein
MESPGLGYLVGVALSVAVAPSTTAAGRRPAHHASAPSRCVASVAAAKFPTADIVITYTPARERDAFAIAQAINRQQLDNPTSSGVTLVYKTEIPAFERDKVVFNKLESNEAEAVEAQRILAPCGIKAHDWWMPSPQNGDYHLRLAVGLR